MFNVNLFLGNLFESVTHMKERKIEKDLFEKEFEEMEEEAKYLAASTGSNEKQVLNKLIYEYRLNSKEELGYSEKSKFANNYYDKLNKKLAKKIYKQERRVKDGNKDLINEIDTRYNFTNESIIMALLITIIIILVGGFTKIGDKIINFTNRHSFAFECINLFISSFGLFCRIVSILI